MLEDNDGRTCLVPLDDSLQSGRLMLLCIVLYAKGWGTFMNPDVRSRRSQTNSDQKRYLS